MLGFFETVTLTAIVTGVCRHEAYEDKCAAFAEQLRSETNTLLEPFEAWEIAVLTAAIVYLIQTVYSFLFGHEGSFVDRFKKGFFAFVCKLPIVSGLIKKELDKTRVGFAKSMLKGHTGNSITRMPQHRMKLGDLDKLVTKYRDAGGFNKRHLDGKVSGTIYIGSDEEYKKYSEFLTQVYGMFAWTNPLHLGVFPGVRQMEAEVVAMCASIFNGSSESCGSMSSGGTESIMLACKAYRDFGSKHRGITKPNMVCCTTAHPAFDKACQYLGISLRKAPCNPKTCKADVRAMARQIDSNTVAIVGSGPQYPHGCVDPIEDLAKVALKNGVGLHVDCCLGSFVVPFMKKAGFEFPNFDFGVTGVTSISLDTHKFGFAPKGSSVILYSNHKLHRCQYSAFANWPGGVYGTPSLAGSRPGGLIAATWAALVAHGEDGYIEATKRVIKARDIMLEGIRSTPGIRVMCEPEGPIISWTSDTFDINRLAYIMNDVNHWDLNVLQFPPAMHICVTLAHANKDVPAMFLREFKAAAAECMKNPGEKAAGAAAMYGMSQSIPDRRIVEDVIEVYIDTSYIHNE